MHRILRVSLSRGGKKAVEHFEVIEGQEQVARNFIAIFAHNAGLRAEYELLASGSELGEVKPHAANAIAIEQIVAVCAKQMQEPPISAS